MTVFRDGDRRALTGRVDMVAYTDAVVDLVDITGRQLCELLSTAILGGEDDIRIREVGLQGFCTHDGSG